MDTEQPVAEAESSQGEFFDVAESASNPSPRSAGTGQPDAEQRPQEDVREEQRDVNEEDKDAGTEQEQEQEQETAAGKGAGKDDIDLARKAMIVEQSTEDLDCCSICLDEYEKEDPGMVTQCEHSFHLQCIMQWAQRSRECPLCFKPLQLKDPAMNELLPFGEYQPPPSQRAPVATGSLLVGLEGWELERLLHRLALVGDARGGGTGVAAGQRGSRRGSSSRSSRRGHLTLTRGQVQSLRERAAAQQAAAAAGGAASASASRRGAAANGSANGSGSGAKEHGGAAGPGANAAAAAGGSGTAAAGGGGRWSLPRVRAASSSGEAVGSSGSNAANGDSHIIAPSAGARGSADLTCSAAGGGPGSPTAGAGDAVSSSAPSSHGGTPKAGGLLARCRESLNKTTRELRRALFKHSPAASAPGTPTAAANGTAAAAAAAAPSAAPPPAPTAAASS